jgi:cell wall-associated NlpC family hydrolase
MFTSYEGVNPPKNYYTNQISFPDPPDLNSETSSENSTTSSSSSFDGVVSPYESAYSISNDPIIDTDRDLDSDTPTQQGSTKAHKSTAESIVDLARTYVGTPYNYAHETPEEGFDCSGLIKYAFG